MFFSWPTLLPLFADRSALASRLPRKSTLAFFSIFATIAVYFNTIVHPFLLADNRHYTFYVTRLLVLRHWSIKYLAIPVYFVCGWLTIAALGGTARPRRGSVVATSRGRVAPDTVHVTYVLVWLISTALCLITAPLIEPRYFIVPWLMWRLHVPEVFPSQPRIAPVEVVIDPKRRRSSDVLVDEPRIRFTLHQLGQWSSWIEFAWYMVINLATCWMFLYRPFQWPQEPGKEQRFMW